MSPALAEVAEELRALVRGRVSADEPMASFTSFRLGGPAGILVEPEDEEDLEAAARVVIRHRLPSVVLGRGSNVLVSDRGFPGVVIRLGKGFDWVSYAGGGGEIVVAGGATPLPRVANWAARRGLAGMEFAVAIPATVGGGVRMNAGAHGRSISDVLVSATICRVGEGARATLSAGELGLAYRASGIGPADVVCSARFSLRAGSREEVTSRMAAYRDHRALSQPAEAPNAGSMFKNPTGAGKGSAVSAGRLIEEAGLKGHRVGSAEVSTKHANFILAHRGATSEEVYRLLAEVQACVLERSGLLLLPEVRLVGSFEHLPELREEP
ncbi:MAG: UDP-N-acetylmuramate dehydrogenase [Candidatus Methylomirabilales bacterium]